MRIPIFNKLFLSHFLAIVLVSGSIGSYFYLEASQSLKDNLQNRLMNSAALISHFVDADSLENIRNSSDVDKPEYRDALTRLRQLRATNPDIAFLYIMRKAGDKVEFVVDSDETDNQALPGQVYEEEIPELMKGFTECSHDEDIYEDKWGAFMSGYAPLLNGKGLYLIGMDMRADEVRLKFIQLKISGIISLSLSIILALIFSRLMAVRFNESISILARKCTEIAGGSYEQRIDIRTNDELNDLILSFNHMAGKVREEIRKNQLAHQELEKANVELEQRVSERTHELTESNVQLRNQMEETKRALEATRRAESQLLQVHKLETIGAMAGGIAHDFNNLLFGVVGNSDLLLAEMSGSPEAMESLRQIKDSGLRAKELTSHLLTYAGKCLTNKETINLNKLVHDMDQFLRGAISRHVDLQIIPGMNLPDIKADISQLRQVIMNLVINASEAMNHQGGRIVIRTGSVDASRAFFADCYFKDELPEVTYVYLEVEDYGPGINEHDLERIFDPFFTTKYEGRGLGLSVVAGIIRSHHGAIKVRSDSKHGTCFSIFFPTMEQADKSLIAPPVIPAAVSSVQGDTILVVDDEAIIRQVVQKILERSNYKVICATCGEEAIEIYKKSQERIGLIILDWTMPDMNGDSVIQAIRVIRPDVPIVVASGYQAEDIHLRLSTNQVSALLEKPYEMKELLDCVKQHFKSS